MRCSSLLSGEAGGRVVKSPGKPEVTITQQTGMDSHSLEAGQRRDTLKLKSFGEQLERQSLSRSVTAG